MTEEFRMDFLSLSPVSRVPFQSLPWCHNGRDGVSNHQPYDSLLNCLFRRRSKKISKLCITGLCEGNSPVTCKFPAQRASNVEDITIWWCHHEWCLSTVSMEISFCSSSTADQHIPTNVYTCHISTAAIACAKFCSNQLIVILKIMNWNCHQLQFVMEKSSVKLVLGQAFNDWGNPACPWMSSQWVFLQIIVRRRTH